MFRNKSNLITLVVAILVIVGINIASSKFYLRFDLTQDHRYTLSQSALNTVKEVDSPLFIDVFLEGDFPSEFRRLRTETRQLLEEFSLYNDNVQFEFFDILEDAETRDSNIYQLLQLGMEPHQLSVQESGKVSQEIIFPWAWAKYNDRAVKIPLLKKNIGASQDELVTNSVQNLEYAFAEAFKKLTASKNKKIAILRGNGEMKKVYIDDFISTIVEHYHINSFSLDSVAKNPAQTLEKLKMYDLILVAKPTEPFTEEEKQVLDQYTMHGGKSLWLTESIIMDKDSLYNASGSAVAVMRDLNLNDFFFKYGIRINPVIVNDLYSAPITLAIGEGSQAQFQPVQWQYSPLATSNPEHPITSNLNLVRFDFASPMDTLKNLVQKTVLLQSSKLTKTEGVPKQISLDMVTQEPKMETYNKGPQPLAVLLEGNFTSVYKNRVKPFEYSDEKDESLPTKIIIISDGDVIKNDVIRGKPQELGFDFVTGRKFGNKEFLQNCVNYLLEDDGLINLRSKEVVIPFMDTEKVSEERAKWQTINILLPILFLVLFGLSFNYLRKRRYT